MKHRAPHISARYTLTGARRLLSNAFTSIYRPQSGWSPAPVLVVLNPTEACNLRCRMCFERGEDIAVASWGTLNSSEDLSLEQYTSLITELAPVMPTFYITGGEPLVSDKTMGIIRKIKAHGLYASLNTNGVLLKENALELVKSGLDKIIVSLDGPRDVHNAIRGNTFDTISEGIEILEQLKKKHRTNTPALRAQCVISPHNAGRLAETVDAVAEMGIGEIRFQHLMFAFSKESFLPDDELRRLVLRGNVSTPTLGPEALDLRILTSEIEELHRHHGPPRIRFEPEIGLNDLKGYYRDPGHTFRNDCISPWRRLVISSQGGMGPCQGICLEQYPERPALEAWNSEKFRSLRKRILNSGLFPNCLRCCHREYYRQRIGIDVK